MYNINTVYWFLAVIWLHYLVLRVHLFDVQKIDEHIDIIQ